jgi:predicted  nucleic acid-binding Zn-ribbon protein
MPKSDELTARLKESDPDIQRYVAALESENAKLQTKIAKLEAQNLSAKNRIAALEQAIEESRPEMHVNISGLRSRPTEEELIREMEALGYQIMKLKK